MTDKNRTGVFSTIGEAAVLYFKNFPLLFSLTLTGMIPMLGYMYLFFKDPKFADKSTLVGLGILLPLAMVFGTASYGALFKSFSAIYRGEGIGFLEAYKTGFKRMFRMLAAYIFCCIWMLLGLLMLIIPGFVFLMKYSLAPVAAVLEDVKISPIKMSAKLTKGAKWQIFLACVLVYLPIIIPGQLINYFGGAYSNPPHMLNINLMMLIMLPGLILGAVYAGVLVIFYEKLKNIKKDEIKEEELKGMNTPLGCLVSFLLLIGIYAAIIAGVIVTVKALGLDKKKPAATSQPELKNHAQDKPEKVIEKPHKIR